MALRLNLSESTFPVPDVLPLLKRYQIERMRERNGAAGTEDWVVDIFLNTGVPVDTVYAVLHGILNEEGEIWSGPNRKYVASDMLHVAHQWFDDVRRSGLSGFGGEQGAEMMVQSLADVARAGLSRDKVEDCQVLIIEIQQMAQ